MFCEKGVFRNFTKFTGKHLCQSLFFNKVAGLRPATLIKKSLWHKRFSVNFVKFLRTPFLTEHIWWLLQRFPISSVYFHVMYKNQEAQDPGIPDSQDSRKHLRCFATIINGYTLFLIRKPFFLPEPQFS